MKITVIFSLFLFPLFGFCQTDSVKYSDSSKLAAGRIFIFCPAQIMTIKPSQISETYVITSNYDNHYEKGLPHLYFRFDKKLNEMANTQAGVLSMDGSTPSIRGARPEGTAYYIDGVRIMDITMPPEL